MGNKMSIAQNFGNVSPSLLLDFANTKTLDRRITFTRSTPACHYDGKTTAMAEQNLITNSQVFTGAPWVNVDNIAFTGSQTAPDGTSTATKLIPNTSNGLHRIFTSTVASGATTTWTISIYAKADGYNYLGIFINGPDKGVLYNLSAGTASDTPFSPYTGATYSITSVGNSWYRCVITVTGTSIENFQLQSWNNTPAQTFAGDGTSGVIIWGAQLEARSTATAYTVTTTQPITNYIPVLLTAGGNQPRFDCNPTTGESLGLLIEEARTNLVTYSADYSNAAWGKTQCSIESNTIVAPDGTLTGDKLIEDTASSVSHFISQSVSLGGSVDSSSYIFIAYAKAGQRTRIRMFDNNQNTSGDTTFNLSTGTIVSGTGTITSVGNGWYRCAIFPLKNYSTTATPRIYLDDGTSSTYTGNGFSGVYIWGGQLEVATFPTSYIATTSASATRTADDASMAGTNFSSWWNQNEGTYYIENSYGAFDNQPIALCDLDLTGGNAWAYANGAGVLSTFYASPVSLAINSSVTASININYRYASAFSPTGKAVSASNTTAVVSANTANPKPSTGIFIGRYSNAYYINGRIKKIAYYPIRVTNAQLQALTS